MSGLSYRISSMPLPWCTSQSSTWGPEAALEPSTKTLKSQKDEGVVPCTGRRAHQDALLPERVRMQRAHRNIVEEAEAHRPARRMQSQGLTCAILTLQTSKCFLHAATLQGHGMACATEMHCAIPMLFRYMESLWIGQASLTWHTLHGALAAAPRQTRAPQSRCRQPPPPV